MRRTGDGQACGGGGNSASAGLLDTWPVVHPVDWEEYVNKPQSETELEALREAIRRGAPLGDQAWRQRIAKRLQIEPSLRPRGRPPKKILPTPFHEPST